MNKIDICINVYRYTNERRQWSALSSNVCNIYLASTCHRSLSLHPPVHHMLLVDVDAKYILYLYWKMLFFLDAAPRINIRHTDTVPAARRRWPIMKCETIKNSTISHWISIEIERTYKIFIFAQVSSGQIVRFSRLRSMIAADRKLMQIETTVAACICQILSRKIKKADRSNTIDLCSTINIVNH